MSDNRSRVLSKIESFSIATGDAPRLLILGSIPGVASLQAVQYYAHPRNAFWPIVCDFYAIDATAPYEQRLAELNSNGVALWDVLHRARRKGSLDSAIERESIEPNAIDQWLALNPSVTRVLLNGGTAAKEFRRHFKAIAEQSSLQIIACPSTSPAYAAMRFEEKKRRWHEALSS